MYHRRTATTKYSVPYQTIRVAVERRGLEVGKAAANLFIRFFQASGVIHRLRCQELECQHRVRSYDFGVCLWAEWVWRGAAYLNQRRARLSSSLQWTAERKGGRALPQDPFEGRVGRAAGARYRLGFL